MITAAAAVAVAAYDGNGSGQQNETTRMMMTAKQSGIKQHVPAVMVISDSDSGGCGGSEQL